MTYNKTKKELLNNPSVSYRLKRAINEFDKADMVDAVSDAECLVALLRVKFDKEALDKNTSFQEQLYKLNRNVNL